MKAKVFLETNYKEFISKVKEYICSSVEMDQYQKFFMALNIQILVLQKGGNNLNFQDYSEERLGSKEQIPKNYLVGAEYVEVIDDAVGERFFCEDKFIKKESGEITGDPQIFSPCPYVLHWFVDNVGISNFVERKIAETILEILSKNVDSFDLLKEDPQKEIL